MDARTFAIVGIRLLAALSFIRTINAISLWIAEKNIDIGNKADIFGLSYVLTVVILCSIPFIVGMLIWIYAPKLATIFCKEINVHPEGAAETHQQPDFLTIGLIAIGVLILINVMPILLMNCFNILFAPGATMGWESVVTPLIKIALCTYVILRANKLSAAFIGK